MTTTRPAGKHLVLLVEDDEQLRDLLRMEISDIGHEVLTADSAEAAQQLLATVLPDLVITDIRLPGVDGLQLMRLTRQLERAPAVIVVTAFGSVPEAVAAIHDGAADFLTKPIDLDRLRLAVEQALRVRGLEQELDRLHHLMGGDHIPGLIGQSQAMRVLREQMQLVARSSSAVLITGESGVGKELIARGIAQLSSRRRGPFVPVNCASVPEQMMESEFFGHRRGAFTGAEGSRKGLFAAADGGTLLLDEISEMPAAMQAKLLRVLQEGRLRPLGHDHEIDVDVRIIAATNTCLEDEVANGRFRADLFYRLEALAIEVPPLRDRGEDIDLLALHFLRLCAHQLDKDIDTLSAAALESLRNYSFPGNVRELRNIIERAATFCQGQSIDLTDLPARVRQSPRSKTRDLDQFSPVADLLDDGALPALDDLQRRYVQYVLERVSHNRRRAAAVLGIGRRTLYRWIADDEQPSAVATTE